MLKIIAHRGFSGRYPENTIIAFKKAVEIGVDEIEFDVKVTCDGHLVVLHDPTVDRTTDGKGNISEMTIKEVKRFDVGSWFSTKYQGIRIPTFEEALENIPDSVELNIHALPLSPVTEKIVSTLLNYGRIGNSYIAIDSTQISLAREICSDIRLCCMRFQTEPEKYIEETKKWKCERLQFNTPSYKITKQLVEKAHSSNIFVNVFYADTEKEMEKLIESGADAILTNYPDILILLRDRVEGKDG